MSLICCSYLAKWVLGEENQISEASIILCQTRKTRRLQFKQKHVRSRTRNDKAFDRAQKCVWLPVCTYLIEKKKMSSGASSPPGQPFLLTKSILTSPWLRGWGRELITGRIFMSNIHYARAWLCSFSPVHFFSSQANIDPGFLRPFHWEYFYSLWDSF